MGNYADFLAAKRISDPATGLSDPPDMPSWMAPHQRDITRWALRRGRAAIFAGTGLGKTAMELIWADTVARHTGKPVLMFAPLGVTAQHVAEADKWGIGGVSIVRSSVDVIERAGVTNYAKLDRFDMTKFGGVILDESSILKAHDGKTRARLIEACSQIPFRLAATATPAPNDFMELGNHAEFLGVMSYSEMLAMFFVHDGGETQKWRLKGHAQDEFWRWMASWSVMLRQPSDLGYPNDGYDLPPLITKQHQVAVEYRHDIDTGTLFPIEARTMRERIGARRSSVDLRVKATFDVVIPSLAAKLPECGNLNTTVRKWLGITKTPSTESACLPKVRSDETICAPTINPIKKSGNERLQKKKNNETPQGELNTPLSQNMNDKSIITKEAMNTKLTAGIASCEKPTGSELQNTTNYLDSKTDYVPFVGEDRGRSGPASEDSELTTATLQEKSGDYSAQSAILASVNSQKTSIGSKEPLNTYWRGDDQWVIWCGLNDEQEALKEMFGDLAISITGSQTDEQKESLLKRWLRCEAPILITKCTILGYGLNLQQCNKTIFCGLNDSFEQVYQATRRFWRFGQKRSVYAHFIASELEGAVVSNIRRKEADAEHMAEQMVHHMADISSAELRGTVRDKTGYAARPVPLPAFMEAR